MIEFIKLIWPYALTVFLVVFVTVFGMQWAAHL
jgi:hypothetical protein